MALDVAQVVSEAVAHSGGQRSRLVDVLREVQQALHCVPREAVLAIARELALAPVQVRGAVTFYAFLSEAPLGRTVIRLSDCPACRGRLGEQTRAALESALGIHLGSTTPDGAIGLQRTACVGLCDQGPGALVDETLVAGLTPDRVPALLAAIRASRLGEDGFTPRPSIRERGEVVLGPGECGAGLRKALALAPETVLAEIKASRLRGRGGAGFPTATKWELARRATGTPRTIICNADEGEPGTFKDRAILTELPERVLEGMAIAAYAIGATQGILYLRGEYAWLRPQLERAIADLRARGVLGKGLGGRGDVDFDVRIQLGAGAYVCGEESALIASCEGDRGVPRDRPPFPVDRGYLERPTVVNNVETLCCAARILEKGARWFASFGSVESTGTKLVSVSGDCARPGVYEIPWGLRLSELLERVGATGAGALLVGGPSGTFVAPSGFERRLGFEDLPTGGSLMVFGPDRDLLALAAEFVEFFADESCGWCTPCRVGNVLMRERLARIRAGQGTAEDLPYLEELGQTMKKMSRCGLGQTAPNPVLTTLGAFRELYEAPLASPKGPRRPSFDLASALLESRRLQGPGHGQG